MTLPMPSYSKLSCCSVCRRAIGEWHLDDCLGCSRRDLCPRCMTQHICTKLTAVTTLRYRPEPPKES